MKQKYSSQAEQLKITIQNIQSECQVMAKGISKNDPYLAYFLKHKNVKELNRGILVDLVKNIYIHQGGEISIEFNFADQHRRIVEWIENNQNELTIIGEKNGKTA